MIVNHECNVSDMAEVIRMPLMSDTMTEGVIAEWLKNVGDKLEPGDILAEVETDKATMELENYSEGTLLYLGANKGEAVPVNGIIAIVGEAGEDFQSLLDGAPEAAIPAAAETQATPAPEQPKEAPVAATPQPQAAQPTVATDKRLKASPLAKKMAAEKGIDLQHIHGSGEDGRIVKRDVEQYQPAAAAAPSITLPTIVSQEGYEEVRVTQMRKAIARRLSESKFTAPHFYLTIEVNMDKAMAARESMNQYSPVKISVNDLVIKAAAIALRQHPKVNASWLGDTIRYHQQVHIGMAVAMEDGLIVPVIRFADNKTLAHISTEAKDLGGRARTKQLQPEEYQGNTFTISNLGMFGIEEFTAIINPPDACIMAVGGVRDIAGVVDGQIKPVKVMKVTLSCDHRVVDGALGAQFLQTFKAMLEDPVRMLV